MLSPLGLCDAAAVPAPAGKKGIALAPADWATMCAALPAISSALAKRDMGYVLQLSGK